MELAERCTRVGRDPGRSLSRCQGSDKASAGGAAHSEMAEGDAEEVKGSVTSKQYWGAVKRLSKRSSRRSNGYALGGGLESPCALTFYSG